MHNKGSVRGARLSHMIYNTILTTRNKNAINTDATLRRATRRAVDKSDIKVKKNIYIIYVYKIVNNIKNNSNTNLPQKHSEKTTKCAKSQPLNLFNIF